MRNLISALVVAVFLAVGLFSGPMAGDVAWFDMENCEFCKAWTENPKLMKNMTHEQYEISNGVLTIATVMKDFMPEFKSANASNEKTAQKLMSGEDVYMCGSCQAMGSFFPRGAKMATLMTKTGSVYLLTSNDTALVADMHKWVKRNNEEMEKHYPEHGEQKGHEGHGHN